MTSFIMFWPFAVFAKTYSTYSKKAHSLAEDVCFRGSDFLISDSDFVDTNYTLDGVTDFIKQFKDNHFTKDEIYMIYDAAISAGISPVVLLAKIECESSLVTNSHKFTKDSKEYQFRLRWILGYGMYQTKIVNGVKTKPNIGFETQVYKAARCLRYWFDRAVVGGTKRINLNTFPVKYKSAGTYALYQYTPFWGGVSENGVKCSGNELFKKVFQSFKGAMK